MFTKVLNIFKKPKKTEKYTGFSDFFLNASPKEIEAVVKEAAHKSNEDQQETFRKSQLKIRGY